MESEKLNTINNFAKKCYYAGFNKALNNDANVYSSWREDAAELIENEKNHSRTDLFNKITSVLMKLDLVKTNDDSFDRISAAREIENLLNKSADEQ